MQMMYLSQGVIVLHYIARIFAVWNIGKHIWCHCEVTQHNESLIYHVITEQIYYISYEIW